MDARLQWPEAVAAATADFSRRHPGVRVKVAYQSWSDHTAKFDASAQGGRTPDVIEMGTTETPQYIAAGAFADLTAEKATFEHSAAWLPALTTACTHAGRLRCVPYYGSNRAVVYRRDLLAEAGATEPPRTWRELMALIGRLSARHRADPAFSPFFFPGQHQYAAMPFVYDAGGAVAVRRADGSWDARFSSPEGRRGLANWKALMDAGYRGDRTINDLTAFSTMVAGKTAMFYDAGGHLRRVYGPQGDPALADLVGSFRLPSPARKGAYVPSFMGGSVLAVPVKSRHRRWALDWIRAYTATANQRRFVAGGGLASSTAVTARDPRMKGYVESLTGTWSVPSAEHWAQVEKTKIIPNMLVDIATGQVSVAAATRAADGAIEEILNGS
ncbi:extracellular solute-binding protein [Bailinhaonella thermotolerans]|uniref:extracellular solute-binding protein n=1 Tax=Bailinhaonella thermotolerans TaxID=1070861 RepID=UPI00192A3DE0|nr:extracellular solute-binding protein [Bailinhaonella thermotolerans]